MKSDLSIHVEWYAEYGAEALLGSAENIAAFVDAMVETRALAMVRRYVARTAVPHRAVARGKTLKSPLGVWNARIQKLHLPSQLLYQRYEIWTSTNSKRRSSRCLFRNSLCVRHRVEPVSTN